VVAPPRPAADALAAIWWAALERLGLPSTRMLLSHQARLAGLAHSRYSRRADGELVARVSVRGNWLPMVQSRRELLANALTETLGRPVAVELVQEVAQ
jgi:DNA polymerase-3 subunit gamma/tau